MYTIFFDNTHYDLPKSMPIPQKDSIVFFESNTLIVQEVQYHIFKHIVNIIVVCNKA